MRIRVVIAIKVAFTFIGAHPEYLTLFNNLNTHILQYTVYTVHPVQDSTIYTVHGTSCTGFYNIHCTVYTVYPVQDSPKGCDWNNDSKFLIAMTIPKFSCLCLGYNSL